MAVSSFFWLGSVVAACCLADDMTYVNGFYSNVVQRLSKYSWYGNVRLYRFRVPEGAELARWSLTVTRSSGFGCGDQNVLVHFRIGAPPVINPIATAFPNSVAYSLAYNLSLSVLSSQVTSVTAFNVTNPEAGDWFLAAHLPKDEGKIEQQGLPSCSYLFQPQMYARKAANTPVLQESVPLTKTLSLPEKQAQFRVFVPEFTSRLNVFIHSCIAVPDCRLSVTLGSSSLAQSLTLGMNCSGSGPCSTSVSSLPWNTWVRIMVENSQPNIPTTFSISANHTEGCKPLSAPSVLNTTFIAVATSENVSIAITPVANSCMQNPAVLREEQDVFAVRFTLVNGSVRALSVLPTMMPLDLEATDSGGTLTVQLSLNATSLIGAFESVRACITPSSPVLQLNSSQSCDAAFMKGYSLQVSRNETKASVHIPYPEEAIWYLTLQTVCNNTNNCNNASALVSVLAVVSACVDDCGPYGNCRLLRTNGYLYAACVCRAGWSGWSCSDGTDALTFSRQLAAVLLLTLSNLFFIPPVVIAVYRGYHAEASVYLLTMFFSTFYHACDQPGVTVLCIMDYDTLQFCDFLGSVVAVWVTIVCMARLQDILKYVFFMAGTLLIAMAVQLDRRGLWNLLGPVLFALVTMITAWVYRTVKQRHCYPPTWKRWVFFLIPGIASAVIGLCVYAFAQTDSNYYYTHSIWHIMVATSVVLLLPPRKKSVPPWGWPYKVCGYKMCQNQKEELYIVS